MGWGVGVGISPETEQLLREQLGSEESSDMSALSEEGTPGLELF